MLLLALFALLALLAEGQVDDACPLKYYTVNTYKAQNNFSFSCYGIDSECEVYYTPPGNGCIGVSVKYVGTVPANETQVFTSEIDFELGGGFCSEYQIGVYYADEADKVEAHLPRAIDAGTNFHIPLSKKTNSRIFDCTMSALSMPVNATISVNDTETLVSIAPFRTTNFALNHNLTTPTEVVTMINSDNPVIVSCFFFQVLVNFQPISSEPLLLVSRLDDFVSLAISDCSTNELIQNFSKVNVTSEAYKIESDCTYNQHDTDKLQVFEVKSSYCYFYVEPLDNACISMTTIRRLTFNPTSVGIPESRFSNRSVNYPDVVDVTLFSFSRTFCWAYKHDISTVQSMVNFLLDKDPYEDVAFAIWGEILDEFFTYSRFECNNPVLVVEEKPSYMNPILSGYQQEELWQTFIEAQCSNALSLTPATSGNNPSGNNPSGNNPSGNNPPGNNPSGNNPSGNNPPGNNPPGPASSDTRSLVSCTSWLALFGFYVLCTSLV